MRRQLLKLGKDSVIYGLGTVTNRFLSMLLLPLFTAYMTPADYGIVGLVTMLGQVVQPVIALGFGTGMGPCYYAEDNEPHRLVTVWTSFALLVGSSLLLLGGALGFSGDIARHLLGSERHTDVVMLSLLSIAASNLAIPFTLRMQYQDRATAFVLVNVTISLVNIGVSILTVVLWRRGALGMLQGQLAASIASALLTFALVARSLRFARPRWEMATKLLKVSLPLVPSFAFLFVILQGNKYFLSLFADLDAVGIYSLGFSIGMATSALVGAVQNAWFPYFMSYANRQHEAPALFARVVTYYTFAAGGMTVMFFACARPAVHLMTQPAFYEAYTVVGIVASAQFFNGLFTMLLAPLYFAGEVKYINLIQCGAALVLCLASLLLIPLLSYFGAALALSLANLALVALQLQWNYRRGARYLQIPIETPRLMRFAMFSAALAFVFLIPVPFVWWQQVAGALVCGVLVASYIFRQLSMGERSALLDLGLRSMFWRARAT